MVPDSEKALKGFGTLLAGNFQCFQILEAEK